MIIAFAATIIVELLLHVRHVWKARKLMAALLVISLPAVAGACLFMKPSLIAAALAYITAARVFNLLRLLKGRIKEQYLRSSALRASRWLLALQVVLLIGLQLMEVQVGLQTALHTLVLGQVAVAVLLLVFTVRNVYKTRHVRNQQHFADKELPTVTVAIPARNETQDLEACLHSLIASDYQKLEILVLDDCSHDRTPDIIKGFAQDGVRFIAGTDPDDNWLPKNAAYDRLFEESTGELVLFCGVDTRFSSTTVRALVTTMMNKQKKMISVMPRRLSQSAMSSLIQPMRYWWELALPRRLFNRPPVLSTCWIIERATLKKLGGFASWKRTIIPEALIARELVKQDAYSFVRADDELDVETKKSWQDQWDTTIRVRYPQLHRRPELAFGLILLEMLFLVAPFVVLAAALVLGYGATALLAALAIALLLLIHLIIVFISNPPSMPAALINFPVVVLAELAVGIVSMVRYEFSTVEWKGRNVCIPVMRVIPHLPRLNDPNQHHW